MYYGYQNWNVLVQDTCRILLARQSYNVYVPAKKNPLHYVKMDLLYMSQTKIKGRVIKVENFIRLDCWWIYMVGETPPFTRYNSFNHLYICNRVHQLPLKFTTITHYY